MPQSYIHDNGSWHQLLNLYTHYSGSWHSIQNVYVKDNGGWHLAWAPGNNTTVFNTPGIQYYTVPPGVYNLLGSYQTPNGIFTGTIYDVQPGQVIGLNIGNYGTTSSVTVNATTYILPAFDVPVLQFDGNVDSNLVVEFSVATPTGRAYRGGIGGSVQALSLVNGGTGYPDYVLGYVQTTSTSVAGNGLEVNFVASGGVIDGISLGVWDGGSGYQVGDTVTILGGNGNATATVTNVQAGTIFNVGITNGQHQSSATSVGLVYDVSLQTGHGDLPSNVVLTPIKTETYTNPGNSRMVYSRWSGRDLNKSVSSPYVKGDQYVAQFSQADIYADEGNYSFQVNLQQILSIGFTPIGPGTGQLEHITITPANLPNGRVGSYYYAQVVAQAAGFGPYTWSVVSGTAPPGLLGDPVLGTLVGVPTTLGTYHFTIKVSDTVIGGTATKSYTINILEATSGLTITTGSLSTPQVGVLYNQQISASGGTTPYVWGAIGILPNGITLNSNTGLLSGVPLTQGTFTFNAVVTDVNGYNATHQYTLIIGQPSILFSALGGFVNATTGTNTITISGGVAPYSVTSSWSNGSPVWPDFIETVNRSATDYSATYTISGTPTDNTNYPFTLTVTDSNGLSGSNSFTVNVS